MIKALSLAVACSLAVLPATAVASGDRLERYAAGSARDVNIISRDDDRPVCRRMRICDDLGCRWEWSC